MRKPLTEYILKGVFLGLVFYLALQQGIHPPPRYLDTLLPVNLAILAGLLVIGIGLAGLVKLRQGYRARGQLLAFVLFLLLECPTLVYLGIIGGGMVAALWIRTPDTAYLMGYTLGGGALAGVVFALLREVQKRFVRLALILVLAGGAVAGGLLWLTRLQGGELIQDVKLFAFQLFLGIPFFYLLTFSGEAEESEVEIGAVCAVLAVAGTILTYDTIQFRSLGVFVPLMLYFWYTLRVLPGLRVLKHAFRGVSYARVGRYRLALLAFRRALQLDPTNGIARDGFWEVHCELDPQDLARDQETLALLDFDLCLERAGSLLIQGRPAPKQAEEANRLLELVHSQRPELEPSVLYWKAVGNTHAKEYDQAVDNLRRVLEPGHYGKDNPQRLKALLQAWQLALMLHPELRRRLGEPQLAVTGRRMEAIAAAERRLAESPDDAMTWDLKRLLYQDLTEEEFEQAAGPEGQAPACDYRYLRELGQTLIEEQATWQRGAAYLRMAARGLPAVAPSLLVRIAQAHERAGQDEEALRYFEAARQAGRAHGVKNLEEASARTYFATLKYLGEVSLARGNLDAAIENYRLYTEYSGSGVETLRTLADLCERKGDPLAALRYTERALVYNGKDPDLVERRKRYYVSIDPEALRARLDAFRDCFDVGFCLGWARQILDAPYSSELEWLETAQQLVELALVAQPDSVQGRVLQARAHLRLGRRDEALALLERLRADAPALSGQDEEAWHIGCQLLGDLYMEVGKADQAIPCYQDFLKSPRSGAKTLLKLGQAHEQMGNVKRAVAYYKQVTAYEGNPLTSEAYDALHRLGA